MSKSYTRYLIGAALDWAVVTIEHPKEEIDTDYKRVRIIYPNGLIQRYSPSTDWSQAGQIIEREKILFHDADETGWSANLARPRLITSRNAFSFCPQQGPTPLIAAMRCYVASKFGDTVEIPAEIV